MAMTAAGTAAQRCGWLVHRVVSIASSAQPEARPTRPAPVMTGSVAPTNTTRTRTRALTRPLTMAAAATTANGTRRPAAGWWPAATSLVRCPAGMGVVVVMSVSLLGGGAVERGGGTRSAWARRPGVAPAE